MIPESFNGSWGLGTGFPELKISHNMGMGVAQFIQGNFFSGLQLGSITSTKRYKAFLALNISNPSTNSSGYNDPIGTSTPKIYNIIDKKIDDGIAMQGIFRAYRAYTSAHGNCLTGINGDYLLSNEAQSCHAIYVLEK